MSAPVTAVFLSYVSQDAEFARRIATSLRDTGVDVWMERGASAEADLRAQITACGVFVPVISANTQARLDGQFRLEWRVAAQLVRAVEDPRSFLIPVVVDATGSEEARVPAEFKSVPWTRTPDGVVSPAFCARVKRLLPAGAGGATTAEPAGNEVRDEKSPERARRRAWLGWAVAVVALLGLAVAGGVYWWRLPPTLIVQPGQVVHVNTAGPGTPLPATVVAAPREQPRALAAQAQRLLDAPTVDAAGLRRADELCRRALALDATDPEILATASLASQALYALDYDATPARLAQAQEYAAQAVRRDANNLRAQLARASGERVAGRPAEAAQLLNDLLRRAPGNPEVLRPLVEAERAAGHAERADEVLAQLKKIPGAEWVARPWETRTPAPRRPHREDPVDPAQKKRAANSPAPGEPAAGAGAPASPAAGEAAPQVAAPAAISPARRDPERRDQRVAVLPFAAPANDPAVAGLAEALSEEVRTSLAKTAGVRVTARASVAHVQGRTGSRVEMARQLGVDLFVEGTVRQVEGKLDVRAQLVKAVDGVVVWDGKFAPDGKAVAAVPASIGRGVAGALQLKSSAGPKSPANLSALELYLRGRQEWNRRTPDALARAEKLFEQALAIEPDFARAHVGLADVWAMQASLSNRIGRRDQRAAPELVRVREKIERALTLDPELAEAHASLGGNVLFESWDFAAAERALRHAIGLNRSYAPAWQWLAWVLISEGRVAEALAAAQEAAELDPLAPRILDNYGLMLGYAGDFAEQLAWQQRSLALQPDSVQAQAGLAAALTHLGRTGEAAPVARGLADRALRAYAEAALAQRAGKSVNEAELRAVFGDEPGLLQAATRCLLGKKDEALALLVAPAANVRSVAMGLFDPVFAPVRKDGRFAEFFAELGLGEAHARAAAWRRTHPEGETAGTR